MITDLVTRGNHPPQHVGILFRVCPEHEKRRLNAVFVEDLQYLVRLRRVRTVVERQRDNLPLFGIYRVNLAAFHIFVN